MANNNFMSNVKELVNQSGRTNTFGEKKGEL